MTDRKYLRRFSPALLLAGALAGCTTQGGTMDDKMGSLLVAPGKYVLYNCEQLAVAAVDVRTREKELLALMAKAGTSGGGQLASAMAYRPEYLERHGEMNELRRSAAAKNCKPLPADNPPARAAVR